MATIIAFLQAIRNIRYVSNLNDGNRRDRRKAKRLSLKKNFKS